MKNRAARSGGTDFLLGKSGFIGERAAGVSPLHPTKNLFEKRFLELPKPL